MHGIFYASAPAVNLSLLCHVIGMGDGIEGFSVVLLQELSSFFDFCATPYLRYITGFTAQ